MEKKIKSSLFTFLDYIELLFESKKTESRHSYIWTYQIAVNVCSVMSGGGFPQSGAFYGSSQQSYYHQNGLNDFQAGQEYGKQSAFVKQGQGTGNGYQQRVDSHSQKPPEMMSSGRKSLEIS